ncbi:hypothetical protein BN2497_13489 [Janthinobacterium sp. CG23_2]|nr:hypothetical protein BN2497_13489 [Janthinobacterium sp. CG23_2]CUU33142.1 hypothetical protein BN3177_13489 [Janthinobacterium sp. CG23_2]
MEAQDSSSPNICSGVRPPLSTRLESCAASASICPRSNSKRTSSLLAKFE